MMIFEQGTLKRVARHARARGKQNLYSRRQQKAQKLRAKSFHKDSFFSGMLVDFRFDSKLYFEDSNIQFFRFY